MSTPLEPSTEEFRTLVETATDYLARFLDELPDRPVWDLTGAAALAGAPELRRPPGEEGRPLEQLLSVLDLATSRGHLNPSPGHLGYIPGSGLVSVGVAELLADVLNRYTGIGEAAPGLVALETALLRWLAEEFGLPGTAGGLLTTGGSMATLSGLVAARHDRLGEDVAEGVMYVSDQAHACAAKAARVIGLPQRAVSVVPVEPDLHLDVDRLRDLIEGDRRAGRRPFCLVGTAGTTNLGVVERLPELADLAAAEDLWFHVDAAYGGFFQLTSRGRERLRGIERADSLVIDAHKGLFLPFGTGCLLVRDTETLRASHSGDEAHYLQDLSQVGVPDFADLGPELTRDTRGLRVWLPLHLHGVAAFRDRLDERLDLAERAYAALLDDPNLELLMPPELSVVAFRCRADDPQEGDRRTAAVLRAVNDEGRVFLSSTLVHGRYLGRICILNHRTDAARVDEAVAAVRRHAAAHVG